MLGAMATKYEQVKSVHELAVETGDANELRKIPPLLNSWGIKCREDDGQPLWTNLSIPTSSVGETITIGLRYIKQDATLTEDIELNKNTPDAVASYYRGRYQQVFVLSISVRTNNKM